MDINWFAVVSSSLGVGFAVAAITAIITVLVLMLQRKDSDPILVSDFWTTFKNYLIAWAVSTVACIPIIALGSKYLNSSK